MNTPPFGRLKRILLSQLPSTIPDVVINHHAYSNNPLTPFGKGESGLKPAIRPTGRFNVLSLI